MVKNIKKKHTILHLCETYSLWTNFKCTT